MSWILKVAPTVEKTDVFRKGWNFPNRTFFASSIMRKHYFLLWTKETAFFPNIYHGIIFYSVELLSVSAIQRGFGSKVSGLQFHECFILCGCFWGFWSYFSDLFFAEFLICNKFAILNNKKLSKILEVGKFSSYVISLSTLFRKWQSFLSESWH